MKLKYFAVAAVLFTIGSACDSGTPSVQEARENLKEVQRQTPQEVAKARQEAADEVTKARVEAAERVREAERRAAEKVAGARKELQQAIEASRQNINQAEKELTSEQLEFEASGATPEAGSHGD